MLSFIFVNKIHQKKPTSKETAIMNRVETLGKPQGDGYSLECTVTKLFMDLHVTDVYL